MNVKKWSMLVSCCCLTLSVSTSGQSENKMPAFGAAEEMVSGWYHRHEREIWMERGARAEVIDAVLQRIKSTKGKRADPELFDTIIAYGPGNWVYEWVQAGELAMQQARELPQRKNRAETIARYNEAITYFTVASWPHLGLPDDKKALALAREAYLAAGRLLDVPVAHVEFPVLDTTTRGYLHLPKGRGPFPLVIFTYGSDVTKENGLGLFTEEFKRRDMALLTVDLTGIGEASHVPLQNGSDTILAAARQFARGLKRVDQTKVFVVGISFGGNAAARYFFNHDAAHDAAGVISMCGPLHRPFMAPPEAVEQLPALTVDGVKSRLGILGQSSEALAKITPQLSLKVQGFGDAAAEKIPTPLLIFSTNQDPVVPLVELDLLEESALHVDKVILDEVGHCPPLWVRQAVIGRWIADQLKDG